eukprot:XP_011418210.1 PREDICTED: protein CBFA2T2 [Crassostrea gigas]
MSPRVSPNGVLNLNSGPIKLEDISLSRELRERERAERDRVDRDRSERGGDRHYQPFNNNYSRSDSFDPLERMDDDWRHVETMLNCIIGMVDKTKRALAVLNKTGVNQDLVGISVGIQVLDPKGRLHQTVQNSRRHQSGVNRSTDVSVIWSDVENQDGCPVL